MIAVLVPSGAGARAGTGECESPIRGIGAVIASAGDARGGVSAVPEQALGGAGAVHGGDLLQARGPAVAATADAAIVAVVFHELLVFHHGVLGLAPRDYHEWKLEPPVANRNLPLL